MFFPILLSALVFLSTTTATPLATCPPRTGPSAIQVRLPPSLDPHASSSPWTPPRPDWYFKPWCMIYASNPQYTAFRNLQYDPTPIIPSEPNGQVNDLTSFQLPNNSTIYTTYGIDTPHPIWPAVLDYAGTGILEGAKSQYSLMAWGCDEHRVPYYVSYSTATDLTATPAGIDVMSTSDEGVGEETVRVLFEKLGELESEEIVGLVGSLTRMVQDGRRRGMERMTCDEECKTNRNLIDILG